MEYIVISKFTYDDYQKIEKIHFSLLDELGFTENILESDFLFFCMLNFAKNAKLQIKYYAGKYTTAYISLLHNTNNINFVMLEDDKIVMDYDLRDTILREFFKKDENKKIINTFGEQKIEFFDSYSLAYLTKYSDFYHIHMLLLKYYEYYEDVHPKTHEYFYDSKKRKYYMSYGSNQELFYKVLTYKFDQKLVNKFKYEFEHHLKTIDENMKHFLFDDLDFFDDSDSKINDNIEDIDFYYNLVSKFIDRLFYQ